MQMKDITTSREMMTRLLELAIATKGVYAEIKDENYMPEEMQATIMGGVSNALFSAFTWIGQIEHIPEEHMIMMLNNVYEHYERSLEKYDG